MKRTNFILLAIVLLLAMLPLLLPVPSGVKEPFAGADDQGMDAIVESNPDYKPWFESLWKPPSGEIESLLFALQAGLGSGLLFYYIGLRRGQAQRRKQEQDGVDAGD